MRLIDADALYDKIESRYKASKGQERKAYGLSIDDVCDAKTICVCICAVCGHAWSENQGEKENYVCPNCGTNMNFVEVELC